jgi:hypothetical protein
MQTLHKSNLKCSCPEKNTPLCYRFCGATAATPAKFGTLANTAASVYLPTAVPSANVATPTTKGNTAKKVRQYKTMSTFHIGLSLSETASDVLSPGILRLPKNVLSANFKWDFHAKDENGCIYAWNCPHSNRVNRASDSVSAALFVFHSAAF